MVRLHIGASVSDSVPCVKTHVVHDNPLLGNAAFDEVIFHCTRFVGTLFVNATAHKYLMAQPVVVALSRPVQSCR